MCAWIPRVCCNAVLHSSIVSRLFLLPLPRLTCLWAGCSWHVALLKDISVVTRSSVVVGCRRKWAIEGSGLGDHDPFSSCHLGPEVLWVSVGAHGSFVRFSQPSVQSPSWSWLPIVEAPDVLGTQPPRSDAVVILINCFNPEFKFRVSLLHRRDSTVSLNTKPLSDLTWFGCPLIDPSPRLS